MAVDRSSFLEDMLREEIPAFSGSGSAMGEIEEEPHSS